MSNPDVAPVGFAATDHPHSPLQRRRGVWWLLAGGLLVVGGLIGVGLFVWRVVSPGSEPADDAVARGEVAGVAGLPTAAATFVVETSGTFTVWIDTDGTIDSGARDSIVGAANCEATFADGSRQSFRGAVQGTSVEVGDFATVGTFDAPAGPAAVTCRSELFGPRSDRDQLAKTREFFVTPGSPDSDVVPFIALFAGLAAAILGVVALGRGWRGSLKSRSS